MLSRQERVNILITDSVDATVSVNLYEMGVAQAIRAIAKAAGFAVKHHDGGYFVVERDEAGKYSSGGLTKLRTFKIQYSDPTVVEGITQELSRQLREAPMSDEASPCLLVLISDTEIRDHPGGLVAELSPGRGVQQPAHRLPRHGSGLPEPRRAGHRPPGQAPDPDPDLRV